MNRRTATTCLALLLAPGLVRAAEPVPVVPRKFFFATGSTRGSVGGHVVRGSRDLYSLQAVTGQVMTVTLTAPDDNAVFQIWEPGTTITRVFH